MGVLSSKKSQSRPVRTCGAMSVLASRLRLGRDGDERGVFAGGVEDGGGGGGELERPREFERGGVRKRAIFCARGDRRFRTATFAILEDERKRLGDGDRRCRGDRPGIVVVCFYL